MMLKPLLFTASIATIFTFTHANAEDFKQEVDAVRAAYQECIGKHDPACVAALYSKDGTQVSPFGVFTDIKAEYTDAFTKNGEDKADIRTDDVSQVGDVVIARGDADIFFTDKPKWTIYWADTLVRENGKLKIRLLTWGQKASPPPTEEAKK